MKPQNYKNPTTERKNKRLSGAIAVATLFAPARAFAQEAPADDVPAIVFEAAYTADYLVNVQGGVSRDDAYLDNFDLVLTIDGEKLLGWHGATISAATLYNNRTTFSERVVGDSQVLSNIDTDGSFRLYEFWLEQSFGDLQVKAGLIDLNSEFDVSETGAFFMGSSHGIGPDFSQIGENGPSIFPITGLAALARAQIAPNIKVRAGVFEGTPGSVNHPRRTVLRLDDNEGQLVVGEVEFNPWQDSRLVFGARRLSGRAASLTNPGLGARDAQFGAYALIEGPVAEMENGSVKGFVRYGYADPKSHDVEGYLGAGLVYSGRLFAGGGANEQLGLSFGNIRNADRYMLDQTAAGKPADRRETSIELAYRVQAAPWLALQPNAHYIVNPGTNPTLRDALVLGLRVELSWSTAN